MRITVFGATGRTGRYILAEDCAAMSHVRPRPAS
jgi:uncharacterized protein YbjT (DUF2867 family)